MIKLASMQVARVFLLASIALVIPKVSLGASLPPKCPDGCVCEQIDLAALRLRCTSLDFLGKIQPKQILAIDVLDLTGLGLQHIDPKLSKLRNLKALNLSDNALSQLTIFPHLPKLTTLSLSANHLKQFTADNLPETLEYLDVSKNYISDLPKDLFKLSYLRHLVLEGNPVRCGCDALAVRDKLFKSGVVMTKPVTCHAPEKMSGRSYFDVSCADENPIDYWDQMQGDDPFADEGSGDGAVEGTTVSNDETNVESLGEQFLPSNKNESKSAPLINDEVEGSGESDYSSTTTEAPSDDYDYESSGFGNELDENDVEPTYATPPPHDSACIFDCSTEEPTTTTIDPFSATQPGIIDGIKIILNDLSGRNETDKKELGSAEGTIVPVIVGKEESVPHEPDNESSDKDDVDVFDSSTKDSDELSRQVIAAKAEEEPDQSVTYIVVAVLIVIMICLVVFSIIKKRKQRSRRPDAEYKIPPEQNSQELKDMSRKSNGQAEDLPEKIPLINGQNGKAKENGNGVNEQPIYPTTADTYEAPPSPGSDVQLRSNGKDSDHLMPEAHRVTVHAKQLTTPKTPLLVNRHRSDDGSIVTTPSSEQMS